jgi:hypothetical protein
MPVSKQDMQAMDALCAHFEPRLRELTAEIQRKYLKGRKLSKINETWAKAIIPEPFKRAGLPVKITGQRTYLSSVRGVPGVEYQIDIDLDGHHFTSTSVMQKMPTINKFHFFWEKVVTEKLLMAELLFQDIPNEDNWYFIHLYRNDEGFRWAVKRDDRDPDGELQQLFSFAREGSDDKDMLYEGDELHLELRTIDQRTYDYFYSMQIMGNTGTNPIQNFTGGCLGYFSAYSEETYDCTYHLADVDEEREKEEE